MWLTISFSLSLSFFSLSHPGGFFSNGDQNEFVLYQKERTPKVIGQYYLGDIIGEGAYSKVREAYCSLTLR